MNSPGELKAELKALERRLPGAVLALLFATALGLGPGADWRSGQVLAGTRRLKRPSAAAATSVEIPSRGTDFDSVLVPSDRPPGSAPATDDAADMVVRSTLKGPTPWLEAPKVTPIPTIGGRAEQATLEGDIGTTGGAHVRGSTEKSEWLDTKHVLGKYEIMIVIDRSSSMGERDCPGGISRWEWCGQQTEVLTREAVHSVPDGITLILFSHLISIYPHSDLRAVAEVFGSHAPSGSTNTAGALKAAFDQYFVHYGLKSAKPLLVIVITDGKPDFPPAVSGLIAKVTTQLRSKDDVKIVFCQIGQDEAANRLLDEMDVMLPSQGAMYDIVEARYFPELEQSGLTPTLLKLLNQRPPKTNKADGSDDPDLGAPETWVQAR